MFTVGANTTSLPLARASCPISPPCARARPESKPAASAIGMGMAVAVPCRGPTGPSLKKMAGTPRRGMAKDAPVWGDAPPTSPPISRTSSSCVIAACSRAARASGEREVSHQGLAAGSPQRAAPDAAARAGRPDGTAAAVPTRRSAPAVAAASRRAGRFDTRTPGAARHCAERGPGAMSPADEVSRTAAQGGGRRRGAHRFGGAEGGQRTDVPATPGGAREADGACVMHGRRATHSVGARPACVPLDRRRVTRSPPPATAPIPRPHPTRHPPPTRGAHSDPVQQPASDHEHQCK